MVAKATTKAKRKPAAQSYRYTGGAYIHGIPARDLTAAEYKQFTEVIEAQQRLINNVLYEPVTVSQPTEEV